MGHTVAFSAFDCFCHSLFVAAQDVGGVNNLCAEANIGKAQFFQTLSNEIGGFEFGPTFFRDGVQMTARGNHFVENSFIHWLSFFSF